MGSEMSKKRAPLLSFEFSWRWKLVANKWEWFYLADFQLLRIALKNWSFKWKGTPKMKFQNCIAKLHFQAWILSLIPSAKLNLTLVPYFGLSFLYLSLILFAFFLASPHPMFFPFVLLHNYMVCEGIESNYLSGSIYFDRYIVTQDTDHQVRYLTSELSKNLPK